VRENTWNMEEFFPQLEILSFNSVKVVFLPSEPSATRISRPCLLLRNLKNDRSAFCDPPGSHKIINQQRKSPMPLFSNTILLSSTSARLY